MNLQAVKATVFSGKTSLIVLIVLSLVLLAFPGAQESQSIKEVSHSFAAERQLLLRILEENIIPFWYPQVLDEKNGGYCLNHDSRGRWKGPAPKALVTQARTLWFFSYLINNGWEKPGYLQAARHGFDFLKEKMWDHDHGGFFWEVSDTGLEATRPQKHLYGISFGLYALSEYYLASRDRQALDLANRLFDLLEIKAHDSQYGGYREFFLRDWSPAPQEEPGYMGVPPSVKLMNTHLHLMEAMTTYYKASQRPRARERLIELIHIQSNSVVRKQVGACTDKYARDWTPLEGYERISYGHDIENVWLLVEACRAAEISWGPFLDLFHTLSHYSLKYGFDWDKGGFFDTGPFNRPADRLSKIWWVQAEGLASTSMLYRMTGEKQYLEAFRKTLQWLDRYQIDWENGEWFAQISEGTHSDSDKAGPWKSPYHNGRAVIVALQQLSPSSQ